MGGLISVKLLLAGDAAFDGLILSGPLVVPNEKLATPVKVFLARTLASLLPRLRLEPLGAEKCSRDPLTVRRYQEDPLIYNGGLYVRTAFSLLKACDGLKQQLPNIKHPILVLQGECDVLCAPQGAQLLFDSVSGKDKLLIRYPNLFHEILNEPERAQVHKDFLAWIAKRISKRCLFTRIGPYVHVDTLTVSREFQFSSKRSRLFLHGNGLFLLLCGDNVDLCFLSRDRRLDQVDVLLEIAERLLFLHSFLDFHSVGMESGLALRLNFLHTLHRLDGLCHQDAIVRLRHVSSSLKVKGCIRLHLLAVRPPVRFGPAHFSRIAL